MILEKIRNQIHEIIADKSHPVAYRAAASRAIGIIDGSIKAGVSIEAYTLIQLGACMEKVTTLEKELEELRSKSDVAHR